MGQQEIEATRPQITAANIAGWFQEWATRNTLRGKRQRQPRSLPTGDQCQHIAELIVEKTKPIALRPGGMINAWFLSPGLDDAFETESAAKIGAIIEATKKADCAIRGLRKWMDQQGDDFKSKPIPEEFAQLKKSTEAVLAKWERPREQGRPTTYDSVLVPMRAAPYAEACKKALIAAGWRRNVSIGSESGPVMFVVTKILKELGITDVKPETVARQSRRAKLGK